MSPEITNGKGNGLIYWKLTSVLHIIKAINEVYDKCSSQKWEQIKRKESGLDWTPMFSLSEINNFCDEVFT